MITSTSPTISVIICTYNRHSSLQRAIDSVLLQNEKDFELIIIDDGSDEPVEIHHHTSIHLIRTKHGGIGAARSEGLNAARGTFVAYCDDDDEWKPNHLSKLLQYLRENPDISLVYGDSEWVQADVSPSPVAYSFDYDGTLLSYGNYIFATDVMHRRSAAVQVGGFDSSLQAYEDWDLWLRMSQVYLLRHIPVAIASHHWHQNCLSAGDRWQEWEKVYWNHQQRLAKAGAVAQHDLIFDAAEIASFDRSTWQPGRRELIWHSILRPNEGYGSVGRQLLKAVANQGVDITIAPTKNQAPRGFEDFFKPLDRWSRIGFYYHYAVCPSVLPCDHIVNYCMWESTLVPKDFVEEINKSVTLQYVPCQQNVESFLECGVNVPIKVLHHGVDTQQFPLLNRYHSEVFTFGTFGDFSPRKGIDVLMRAFQDEFSPQESVRLLMKSSVKAAAYEVNDARIKFISGFMNQEALLKFLQELNVFILPSRGEGFGLCGLEAMSTGLPLIATNWSGPSEYLNPEDSFLLDYRLVDAQGIESNRVRYFGMWAEPDYEHLRYLMRWLYEHPSEAAVAGQKAARRVHANWRWERVAKQMCADFDQVAS
ncbi:glycosyltransferase [uncultured Nostoc sp.]|uniref:glycosyltransferase n=1 Tax=uncultured Nostoc sp. TaxID=340711 RepID=UPI0035CB8728